MSYESPRILSQEHLGATRKDSESEWLARDHPETNSITLKGKTASHTAEQFSWVPLPCGFTSRQPFPMKPLALSACMPPWTIHSRVLDKSPLSGAGRGPPSCTILHGYWCHGRKNGRWCDECWQGHLGRVGGKGVSERWWLSWDGDDEKPPDSKEESEAPRWEQAWQTQGPGEGTVAGAQFILPLGGPSVWREAIPLHSLSSCASEASEGADAVAAKMARSTFLPVPTSSAMWLDGSSPPCPTSQVQNGPWLVSVQ